MHINEALPSPGRLQSKNEEKTKYFPLGTRNFQFGAYKSKSTSWLSTEVGYYEMAMGSENQVCYVSFTRH